MKKFFLLLLSLMLILSLFSGCGGSSDNGEETKNGQDGSNTSEAVETTTKGVNIENFLRPWEQGDGEVTGVIRKQVLSGTHDYDMFVAMTYRTVEAIGEDLFWNLSELEYLDLSNPYWSQGFNDAASVGSHRCQH